MFANSLKMKIFVQERVGRATKSGFFLEAMNVEGDGGCIEKALKIWCVTNLVKCPQGSTQMSKCNPKPPPLSIEQVESARLEREILKDDQWLQFLSRS